MKIPKVKHVYHVLLEKLSDKGLTPVEVSRLIKDVVNIIGDGGEFTVPLLNQELERLGWEGHILDEFSFELILDIVKSGHGYAIVEHTVH